MIKGIPNYNSFNKIGGRIVNIASMAGLWPNRGLRNVGESGYSMAKFGAIALTRSFSQNDIFSKDGVKAVALCPWYTIFFVSDFLHFLIGITYRNIYFFHRFTNTQFVTTVFSTDAIEQKFKYRVLETSEV